MTTVSDVGVNNSNTTQDTKLCKITSANPKYLFKNKVNPKAAEDDPNKNLWSLEDLIDGFGKKGVLCSKTLDTRNQCLRFRVDLAALAAADPQFRDAQAKLVAAAAAGAAAAANASDTSSNNSSSNSSGMGYSPGPEQGGPIADGGPMADSGPMPTEEGGPIGDSGPMAPTDTDAAAAAAGQQPSSGISQGMESTFMEPPPQQPTDAEDDLGSSSDLDRKRQEVLAAAPAAVGGLKTKFKKGQQRTTRKNLPMPPPSKGRGGQGPAASCPPQCQGNTAPGLAGAAEADSSSALGRINTTGDLGSSTKLFLVHEKIDKDERGWWEKLTNQPVVGGKRRPSGMGNSLRMIKDLMKQNKQLQQYSKRQWLVTQKRKHRQFQRQLTRKRC
jgi:hypothetical protein